MKAKELERLGLWALADLRRFSFTTLHGSHFKFFLPTFHGPRETIRDLIEERFDAERLKKFAGTGVIGLNLYDQARAEQLEEMRANSIRNARGSGLVVPTKPRVAMGIAGRLIAYAEMNRVVSKALEDLDDRCARALARVGRTFGDLWFMKD